MNTKEIWDQVQNICRREISEELYDFCISPLKLRNIHNGTVVVEAWDDFNKRIVLERFAHTIKAALEEVIGEPVRLYLYAQMNPLLPKEKITSNPNILLAGVKAFCRGKFGETVFDTWIDPLQLKFYNDGVMILETETELEKEVAEGQFGTFMENAASELTGKPVRVFFCVAEYEEYDPYLD
jgi:chromosomal replication initiation ATPase DnaA